MRQLSKHHSTELIYCRGTDKTKNVESDIIRLHGREVWIIYCLSRKKSGAQVLQVNGISAVPYHAGWTQNKTTASDMFLMEDVDVVVATIAFGMGIDKPDVRFVIHHDIPKSLESYQNRSCWRLVERRTLSCLLFLKM
jgi:ATP-dependent DNA helicase RecQ